MGQCCSFFSLRPGRRKVQIERVQKGSIERKSTSATSRSIAAGLSTLRATRRSGECPSNATEECEAEAASGFFSISDFSKASGICTSPADGPPTGKEHQTFGRLIAQEVMSDAMRKSTDRQVQDFVGKPSPSPVSSSKASGDGHGENDSSGEITGNPSVADSMNLKGRRSLERLRLLAAENQKSLKKSRSRNEPSTGSHNSSLHSRESKQSLPGPVDFDFLTQKAAAEDPQKTVSQTRRDGERSAPTDLNGLDSTGTSSVSGKEMDDLSKSYKESAAKAAARDRDAFKYISSSENDVSITSSVGASPVVRPRRKRQSRSGSNFSGPDEVIEGSRHDSGTLMKHGADHKQKAGSSPLPRPVGLTRNQSSPSIPRGAPPVEAKPLGLTRIRSSPGSLHRAGITAADAQAQASQKYAHAQFVSRAGKLSSSTRGSTQSRRIGTAFSVDDENFGS